MKKQSEISAEIEDLKKKIVVTDEKSNKTKSDIADLKRSNVSLLEANLLKERRSKL